MSGIQRHNLCAFTFQHRQSLDLTCVGCNGWRHWGVSGPWRDVFTSQKVTVRVQDPSHPFSKEQRVCPLLSREEGVAVFLLYTDGGRPFPHLLPVEQHPPPRREFLWAPTARPAGQGVALPSALSVSLTRAPRVSAACMGVEQSCVGHIIPALAALNRTSRQHGEGSLQFSFLPVPCERRGLSQ